MVWTVSCCEKGVGYANSADLINWSHQKYIPVMEHEPFTIEASIRLMQQYIPLTADI